MTIEEAIKAAKAHTDSSWTPIELLPEVMREFSDADYERHAMGMDRETMIAIINAAGFLLRFEPNDSEVAKNYTSALVWQLLHA